MAVAIALVALMIFVGVPLLIFLLETVWGFILLMIGLISRVLFHRPWTIEASDGSKVFTWSIVGWSRSRQFIETVAGHLQAGGQADQLRAPQP